MVTGDFSRPRNDAVDCPRRFSVDSRWMEMLGRESSKENKLNDYFRRRCSNYERFLCDRVWECAMCARQAGKVELVQVSLPTKVEALRRR
jgi:hypothetical protein